MSIFLIFISCVGTGTSSGAGRGPGNSTGSGNAAGTNAGTSIDTGAGPDIITGSGGSGGASTNTARTPASNFSDYYLEFPNGQKAYAKASTSEIIFDFSKAFTLNEFIRATGYDLLKSYNWVHLPNVYVQEPTSGIGTRKVGISINNPGKTAVYDMHTDYVSYSFRRNNLAFHEITDAVIINNVFKGDENAYFKTDPIVLRFYFVLN